jgi:hypothetical protein
MMVMTMCMPLIMVMVVLMIVGMAVAVVVGAFTCVRMFSMLLKFVAHHRSHFVFTWTLGFFIVINYSVIVATRLPILVLMLMLIGLVMTVLLFVR